MAIVINLQDYKIKIREEKAFCAWKKRFNETFDIYTRFTDLSDKTLIILAEPGQLRTFAWHELIMAVLDLGPATKYSYLDTLDAQQVNDHFQALNDQAYFEIMRRLNWIVDYPCQRYSLVVIIKRRNAEEAYCGGASPMLSESHPSYNEFMKLNPSDRITFFQRSYFHALNAFKVKVKK